MSRNNISRLCYLLIILDTSRFKIFEDKKYFIGTMCALFVECSFLKCLGDENIVLNYFKYQ